MSDTVAPSHPRLSAFVWACCLAGLLLASSALLDSLTGSIEISPASEATDPNLAP
jgi:hypothetical protein